MVVQWVDNATHLHVSAACTSKRNYSFPVQAIEVTAFESNKPSKAKLEVNDYS